VDGELRFVRDERDRRIGRLTLSHAGKLNAMSVSMWGALRTLAEGFDAVGAPALAAIIVAGEGGNFAAGADIEEFPAFRFDERTLRQLRPSPSTANARRGHFDYADAEFHHEGIRAFIERRAPRFDDTDA